MARYRVRYAAHAAEQLRQLPRPLGIAFDVKVYDLERDPYTAGEHDEEGVWYSTTFSGDDEGISTPTQAAPELMSQRLATVFRPRAVCLALER